MADSSPNTTLDDFLPSRIYLIDQWQPLVDEWSKAFAVFPEITPLAGDYFQQAADAMVSPANSFGIMDGGLDLAIRDQLGYAVQARIQTVIVEKYHGELPVGCAEIVETDHDQWKYMVSAATMRIPEPVAHTLNAYKAFRAILLAVAKFNQSAGTRAIDSLVCCGLGTGVGGMPAARCAGQMQAAYKSLLMPALIGRFESIHGFHDALRKL